MGLTYNNSKGRNQMANPIYGTIVTKFQKFSHFIDDSKQVPAGARRRTATCVKRLTDSSQINCL